MLVAVVTMVIMLPFLCSMWGLVVPHAPPLLAPSHKEGGIINNDLAGLPRPANGRPSVSATGSPAVIGFAVLAPCIAP